jgi:hypothetical protein
MCSLLEQMIIAVLGLWIVIVLIGGTLVLKNYITKRDKL